MTLKVYFKQPFYGVYFYKSIVLMTFINLSRQSRELSGQLQDKFLTYLHKNGLLRFSGFKWKRCFKTFN